MAKTQAAPDLAPAQELVFEERAENLTQTDLERLTVLSDAEKAIVKKLIGPGAKLLSGPRGSGKSTLFRIAFYEAARSRVAIALYVNYAKALAIEPLFHSHADAAQLFRQWVLAKIIAALREVADVWSIPLTAHEEAQVARAETYIDALAAGSVPSNLGLSPSGVTQILKQYAERAGVARTVLLLDDAAHAFSVKQQREFFEIFRELRSRDVAGKAAIYPGVTSFSPSFQVGHEAELIEAWFRPDQDSYLPTMRQIVAARFPTFAPKDPRAIDVLALASFGLPRGFLSLCYLVEDSGNTTNSRKAVLDAIGVHADVVRTVFSNIADRLPRFQNFIAVGSELERAARAALRDYNRGKETNRKSGSVAISEPVPDSLQRVLRFMEYAGLVRRVENLSKGVKGTYRRYLIHYACLISGNSLSLGKSFKVSDIASALSRPHAHELVKTKADTLLGTDFEGKCTLALPPCPKCNTERIAEDQKFCMNCGFELKAASVYQDLLEADVEKLPLPKRKIEALKELGFLRVKQLLSSETQSFRRPGSSIGPVWAKRIATAAEEWVSV